MFQGAWSVRPLRSCRIDLACEGLFSVGWWGKPLDTNSALSPVFGSPRSRAAHARYLNRLTDLASCIRNEGPLGWLISLAYPTEPRE